MATSHAHFHVPHFHVRAPHVDWHDVDDRLVGALAAGSLAMAIGAGFELPAPSFTSAAPPASTPALEFPDRPLPREWRGVEHPSFDSMYGRVESNSLDWIR